jgi:hypothetical protein
MAQLPKIDIALNTTFNYIGSVNELPKDGTVGQIVLETGSNIPYVYVSGGASWVELASLLTPTKTIKEELLEVIDRNKGSKIAEDVRNLLEVYERGSYV